MSEDHAAGQAAGAGRRRGAGADTWAGNGLVSEDHAVPTLQTVKVDTEC